jgi:hypothetical protein
MHTRVRALRSTHDVSSNAVLLHGSSRPFVGRGAGVGHDLDHDHDHAHDHDHDHAHESATGHDHDNATGHGRGHGQESATGHDAWVCTLIVNMTSTTATNQQKSHDTSTEIERTEHDRRYPATLYAQVPPCVLARCRQYLQQIDHRLTAVNEVTAREEEIAPGPVTKTESESEIVTATGNGNGSATGACSETARTWNLFMGPENARKGLKTLGKA